MPSMQERLALYRAENEVAEVCGEPHPYPHPQAIPHILTEVPQHVRDFYFEDTGLSDDAQAATSQGTVPFEPSPYTIWLHYHPFPGD